MGDSIPNSVPSLYLQVSKLPWRLQKKGLWVLSTKCLPVSGSVSGHIFLYGSGRGLPRCTLYKYHIHYPIIQLSFYPYFFTFMKINFKQAAQGDSINEDTCGSGSYEMLCVQLLKKQCIQFSIWAQYLFIPITQDLDLNPPSKKKGTNPDTKNANSEHWMSLRLQGENRDIFKNRSFTSILKKTYKNSRVKQTKWKSTNFYKNQ